MRACSRLLWTLAVPIMVLALAGFAAWASYAGWSPVAPEPVAVISEESMEAEEDFQEERENFEQMCTADPNCRR